MIDDPSSLRNICVINAVTDSFSLIAEKPLSRHIYYKSSRDVSFSSTHSAFLSFADRKFHHRCSRSSSTSLRSDALICFPESPESAIIEGRGKIIAPAASRRQTANSQLLSFASPDFSNFPPLLSMNVNPVENARSECKATGMHVVAAEVTGKLLRPLNWFQRRAGVHS